ncbi:MAG: pilus assembly protein PilM, partial [Candidatus Binatia bacterium]
DQPPAADGESTLALDGSELDTGLAPSEGEGEAPIGAFELDMGPGTPEAEGEADSPGAFELDMGPSPEDTDPEQTVGVELDFGGAAATETETEGDAEGGLGVFDLAVEDTEPDTEETGGFSFDLEEPSSEEDAPGVVGVAVEQDAEAAAATEDETSGGLMDLDDLAGLAELGTAGGEVTQDSLYAAISPVINELLTETRRSLEYYTSRYQGAAIDKVLLMGGTARLRGLAEVMASELGLTVEAADLFSKLSYSPKCEIAPEYVDEMSPALSVGLGLAIREMVEG